MNRKRAAMNVALVATANGAVPSDIHQKVLAAARAAGVTNTDYLFAHALLQAGAEECATAEVQADADER